MQVGWRYGHPWVPGGDWVQEPGSQSPKAVSPDVRTVAPSYLRFLLSRYGGGFNFLCIYWKKYECSGPVQFTSVVFKGSAVVLMYQGHHRAVSKPKNHYWNHSLEKQSLCTHPEPALAGQDEDHTSSQ